MPPDEQLTPLSQDALAGEQVALPNDFDATEYLRLNPDLGAVAAPRGSLTASSHYLNYGQSEGRRWSTVYNPSEVPIGFDSELYLSSNPDILPTLKLLEINAVQHWILHGRREGRTGWSLVDNQAGSSEARKDLLPEDFNALEYLRLNPDVGRVAVPYGSMTAADHYIEFGQSEGRRWSTSYQSSEVPIGFDAEVYIRLNTDILSVLELLEIDPVQHWILHGRREGRRGWLLADEDLDLADSTEDAFLQMQSGSAEMVKLEQEESSSLQLLEDEFEIAGDIAKQSSPLDILRNGFSAAEYAKQNSDVVRSMGNKPETLANHWLLHGFLEGRTAFGLKPYAARKCSRGFAGRRNAITCYGFFDAQSGLGTAARSYCDGLKRAGFEVTSITVKYKAGRFYTFFSPADKEQAECQDKVNIFFLNADMMHRFFIDGRLYLLDDSYNIGVWFWELAYFRQDWANTFGALDEIWVASEFCRRSLEAVSPIPVWLLPPAVTFDLSRQVFSREYFRIPPAVFAFSCIFDVGSLVDRKNPFGAIHAFKTAFGDRSDVLLLLKYHSANHYPAEIYKLHAAANGAANIRFYGREFDEAENTSFKAAIDCFVSPHRSEGFGLNIAEAMLLGKPVIATNYGGSVDFISEDTGYPVNFQLRAVGRHLGPYPPDAIWAEPDVEDLANKMRFVFENKEDRKLKGNAGRRKIETLYGKAVTSSKLAEHFENLSIFKPVPAFMHHMHAGINYTQQTAPNHQISFSVVVPVYNIEAALLTKCIESVRSQIHTRWELILYDDGSTREDTLMTLASYKGIDSRLKILYGRQNLGIASATNAAIEISAGDFIALLDNDDELAPDALVEMERAILLNQDADLIYSDEDKIEPDGRFSDHYFKPDWSPEHLESVMYLLHFLVIRRSLLLEVGGFREKFSGAQDYDLALRVSRAARSIVHVPKVLYHWRKIAGSASATIDAKPEALDRAGKALQDHLDASGRTAIVAPGLAQGLYRVRDKLPPKLPVTLVIFTDNREADLPKRGRVNLFDHFLASILQTTKTACELHILAVDNGNLTSGQKSKLAANNGRTVSYAGSHSPFNFSKKANFALSHIKTEMFVFLNDDMEVITADWVDALMEFAMRPTSGIVGARLLFPDDSIQHCGIVLGIQNHVAHVYHRQMAHRVGYNGYTHVVRNYLAVTGACMATRMTIVDEIGGFDEALAIDYNDIDYCLRVYEAGYRNIYTPFAALYHFESVTAVRTAPSGAEHELFNRRWGRFMANDPYYNPNLSRVTPDFAPADLSAYR